MRSRASGGSCGDSVAAAQRGDHVELAPARDLHAAREVDRAQADGRAAERAHDRAGVRRVGQQAQPGEHVADLGLREEVRLADGAKADRALLEARPRRRAPRRAASARGRRCARARSRRARAARPPPRPPAPARARRPRARSAPMPPGAPLTGVPSRSAIGATTARAASSTRCGQRCERSRRTTSASGCARCEVAHVLAGRAAQAPRGLVVVGGRRQASPCSAASSSTSRAGAKPRSASSSTSTWR